MLLTSLSSWMSSAVGLADPSPMSIAGPPSPENLKHVGVVRTTLKESGYGACVQRLDSEAGAAGC